MTDRFRLRVFTPGQTLVDEEVSEVTAPGVYGEIGVLPDHAALITVLEAGVLTFGQGGTMRRLQLGGGFAEVRDNVMTVLADSGDHIPQ